MKRQLVIPAIMLVLPWLAGTAYAQLTVQNVSPAHAATNVPLSTTISVTFSAPLDVQNFDPFDDTTYPFNIELEPDSAETEGAVPAISNNDMTVSFQAQLLAETRYTVLVTGARSATGQPLDKPFVFTFTTGNSLPGGSISGSVTYANGSPEGAVVAAFGGTIFGDNQAVCYGVADGSGNYTIEYIPAGEYFPAAIKDKNQDGEIDPSRGDPLGGYDPDQNKFVDRLTLADDEQKGSINIILQHPVAITANNLSPNIDAFAKTFAADAEAIAVLGANLQADGKALAWFYLFNSPSTSQQFGFTATSVACLPFVSLDDDGDAGLSNEFFVNPLPANRIDTDAAIDTALAYGGQDFLDDNTDVEIVVIGLKGDPFALFQGNNGGEGGQLRSKYSRFHKPQNQEKSSLLFDEKTEFLADLLKIQEEIPVWIFLFDATNGGGGGFFGGVFAIGVHMETGAPVHLSPTKSFAAVNTQAAIDTAQTLIADAKLVAILAPAFGFAAPNLEPDGNALFWLHVFHTASLDTFLQVNMSNGLVFGVDTSDTPIISTEELPETFVNSDIAVTKAEAAGGAALRQGNPQIMSEAILAFGMYPQEPARLVWAIRYATFMTPPDQIVTFLVDAITGDVITDIHDDIAISPQDFVLQPVYPNPITANQTLRIPFRLSRNAEVEISLYNLLGQRVRQISLDSKAAGEYAVPVAALRENLAAGVYFVRMRVRENTGKVRIFSQRLLIK